MRTSAVLFWAVLAFVVVTSVAFIVQGAWG